MSAEEAIIARALPRMVASRASAIIQYESVKGCLPTLADMPVSLEPRFVSASRWNEDPFAETNHCEQLIPWSSNDCVRFQVWISPDHKLEWFRAERFIRELRGIAHRIGFEISGNKQGITIYFHVHKDDTELLKAAVAGEFPQCEVSECSAGPFQGSKYVFYDFFPLPPYHHLFTQHRELYTSPYEPFIQYLSTMEQLHRGFVQILFEPARHNWHHNVEVLTDLEFLGRSMPEAKSPYRPPQQLPSGDFYQMATEVETKAHNDKPCYFALLRTGVEIKNAPINARALSVFVSLFQHGGQPLQFLTEEDYYQKYTPEQIHRMFQSGLTYRPGFLVNSSELAGLIHVPTITRFIENDIPINLLETLPPPQNENLRTGTVLGTCNYAGKEEEICIPPAIRKRSTHILGKPDMGKTRLLESMILQDISNGYGVAVIDPHNDCIERLLHFIPDDKVDSTIYLDFGDPDWVPIWNPLKLSPGQDISRTADDLVAAIKNIVEQSGWGDRLERLLKHGFYALLQIPGSTLFDLSKLLQIHNEKGDDRDRLKKLILRTVESEVEIDYWDRQFDQYRKDDFSPPQNKLSKLLLGGTVSLTLSQPDNLINLQDIMDTGKILLINLAGLGSDRQKIMGSFILSLMYQTALARGTSEKKQFHVYCDEAHKMTTGSLDTMLEECRKFGVSLTLAHQDLIQMKKSQQDAMSGVGTTIMFFTNTSDAQYLVKNLQGKVTPENISKLKKREAIARIGTDIVRFRTLERPELPPHSSKEKIIQKSRKRYCRPIHEVKKSKKSSRNWRAMNDDLIQPLPSEDVHLTEPIYEVFT